MAAKKKPKIKGRTISRSSAQLTIYFYFQRRGLLPSGTTTDNFLDVTMAQLALDDPGVPGEPHQASDLVADELRAAFWVQGADVKLKAIRDVLRAASKALGDLAKAIVDNQTPVQVN